MRIVPTDRRREEASRLRIYIGAIREAETMTDAQWADHWVEECRRTGDTSSQFTPRSTWIELLKHWALIEAEKLSISEAA
jgi:hypothetical protein